MKTGGGKSNDRYSLMAMVDRRWQHLSEGRWTGEAASMGRSKDLRMAMMEARVDESDE